MSKKLKTIIILLGLALAIIGLILIYLDFSNKIVGILPISLFVLGVFTSFKMLSKTKHKSRKFKLHQFNEED